MIFSVNFNKSEYPIVELVNKNSDQVVIRFIHTDIHFTLHKKGKEILFTSSSKLFSDKSWQKKKVEIAKHLGFKNPEKHGEYLMHEHLKRTKNNEYFLGSVKLKLKRHAHDTKYLKNNINIGQVKSKEIYVNICKKKSGKVNTSLGYIDISLSTNPV